MGLGSFGISWLDGLPGEGLFDAETLRRRGFSFVLFSLQRMLPEGRYGRACRFMWVNRAAGMACGESRKSSRLAICGERRLPWMDWVVLREDMATSTLQVLWYSMDARKYA